MKICKSTKRRANSTVPVPVFLPDIIHLTCAHSHSILEFVIIPLFLCVVLPHIICVALCKILFLFVPLSNFI